MVKSSVIYLCIGISIACAKWDVELAIGCSARDTVPEAAERLRRCVPMAIAQIPVPVPMSKIRSGFREMGARWIFPFRLTSTNLCMISSRSRSFYGTINRRSCFDDEEEIPHHWDRDKLMIQSTGDSTETSSTPTAFLVRMIPSIVFDLIIGNFACQRNRVARPDHRMSFITTQLRRAMGADIPIDVVGGACRLAILEGESATGKEAGMVQRNQRCWHPDLARQRWP
jgi:hypothetical protein